MQKILAESKNYKIVSEYEYITLHFKNAFNTTVYVGDFYGDPDCAIISKDEKYIVIGGCGLIIYFLKKPFVAFGSFSNENQYSEFFRETSDCWWISELAQNPNELSYFQFKAANDNGEFLYKMNINDYKLEQINI